MTATDGEATARAALTDRFQLAIDEAAMQAGLVGTDEYLEEWRRETRPCGGGLNREVADETARIEETFTPEVLDALVGSEGRREGPGSDRT